jgi:protein-S-isoprenylcysteine O-methyltransferase Ste14
MKSWWKKRFESRLYLLLVRLVGSLWFLFLATVYARLGIRSVPWLRAYPRTFTLWAGALSSASMFVFCLTISLLMWVRPPPRAHANGILPGAIAFAATYLPWLLLFFPRERVTPFAAGISALASLLAGATLVFSLLYLGRSFSIVPQARGLVTSGPYAIVRHPLYLAEEMAIAGVIFYYASSLLVLPLLLLHLMLQLQRIRYEERVLQGVFPEYDSYSKRTARLLPGIW